MIGECSRPSSFVPQTRNSICTNNISAQNIYQALTYCVYHICHAAYRMPSTNYPSRLCHKLIKGEPSEYASGLFGNDQAVCDVNFIDKFLTITHNPKSVWDMYSRTCLPSFLSLSAHQQRSAQPQMASFLTQYAASASDIHTGITKNDVSKCALFIPRTWTAKRNRSALSYTEQHRTRVHASSVDGARIPAIAFSETAVSMRSCCILDHFYHVSFVSKIGCHHNYPSTQDTGTSVENGLAAFLAWAPKYSRNLSSIWKRNNPSTQSI